MDPDGQSAGVARDATLQRLAQMSPAEHEQRLQFDSETVLQLQLSGWSDEAWEPVAEALAEYGFGVFVGWLITGKVFAEVKKVGQPVTVCPRSWLDDDEVQEMAGETVALALNKFKKVLQAGTWNPARGASLATFFVGQCKYQFCNVYRAWFTREQRLREVPVVFDTEQVNRSDPAAGTVGMGDAATILDKMPPLVARVFKLKYLDGYTYKQIAQMVDGVADAKAAENLVTKERARWVTRESVR